jgi:hypothetical protein
VEIPEISHRTGIRKAVRREGQQLPDSGGWCSFRDEEWREIAGVRNTIPETEICLSCHWQDQGECSAQHHTTVTAPTRLYSVMEEV